ncbi:MAG: hypothetical protein GY874_01170 [Desulfobacteraceae bacterium]|nr:hypothetical protein [Desulfobacteraceae bacterium]
MDRFGFNDAARALAVSAEEKIHRKSKMLTLRTRMIKVADSCGGAPDWIFFQSLGFLNAPKTIFYADRLNTR